MTALGLTPNYILEQVAENHHRGHLEAVCLAVDISGFTGLTEDLLKSGKEGAEQLSRTLRAYFDPLEREVSRHGGFISHFAGDGFDALFPGGDDLVTRRALQAARAIQAFFLRPSLPKDLSASVLSVRLGLAHGAVSWAVVDPHGPAPAYYFAGEPLAQAEKAAGEGPVTQLSWPADQQKRFGPVLSKLQMTDNPLAEELQNFTPVPLMEDGIFAQPTLARIQEHGEFRDVTAVYVSFFADDELRAQRLAEKLLQKLHQYGGTLSRFDFGIKGPHMLAFFGAPRSQERHLQRALDFLLACRTEFIDRGFRAGLSRGMSYAGFNGGTRRREFTCLGRAVNLGARLLEKAPVGEIWCGPTARSGAETDYEFLFLGKQALRGLGPQWVFRLESRAKPLVAGGTQADPVGRQQEIDQVLDAARPLLLGSQVGLICIEGEAGIGKTRLVRTLQSRLDEASSLRGRPVLWLEAPTDPARTTSLHPFLSLLRREFNQEPGAPKGTNLQNFQRSLGQILDQIPSRHDPLATRLMEYAGFLQVHLGLPADMPYAQGMSPVLWRRNHFQALSAWLCARAACFPLVIHVEDVHWADQDSLELMDLILKDSTGLPMCMLLSGRPGQDGQPVRPRNSKPALVLALSALQPGAVRELVEARLGGSASDPLIDLLAARGQGNPLFLENLVDLLQARNQVGFSKGMFDLKPGAETAFPEALSAVLGDRIDQLSPEAREVVQVASVLGREADPRLLAEMMSHPEHLSEHLQEAAASGIWKQAGSRFAFRHALLRDAAYDRQSRARLQELHARAARAHQVVFARNPGRHLGTMAWHWERSGRKDLAEEFLEKAARHAESLSRTGDAAGFYERLLDLLGEKGREARKAALAAAQARYLLCEWEQTLNLCSIARRATPEFCPEALTITSSVLEKTGQYVEGLHLAQEALSQAEALGDQEAVMESLRQMGFMHLLMADFDHAEECYKDVLKMAESQANHKTMWQTLNGLAHLKTRRCDYEAAAAYYRRYRDLVERHGGLMDWASYLFNQAGFYLNTKNHEKALEVYSECLTLFTQMGHGWGVAFSLGNLGRAHMEMGNLELAQDTLRRAVSKQKDIGNLSVHFELHLAETLRKLGQQDECRTILEALGQRVDPVGDASGVAQWYLEVGNLHRDQTAFDKARQAYQKAAEIINEKGLEELRNDLDEALRSLE